MAYDKTLPTNSTKIRNYPTVLTDNFAGIEEGDISLKYWQANFIERDAIPSAPATTPTRADDTMIMYSKQDASGETELFILDDRATANDIQVTEDGNLGSASTDITCNTISFDAGVSSMGPLQQVSGWIRVASNGAVTATSGTLTASRDSLGLYSIGFSTAPANANFCGIATLANTSSRRSISCQQYSATAFKVRIYSNSDGNNNDEPFQVVVFGGR